MTRDDGAGRPKTPADPTTALILDFLEWLGRAPRPYPEVMENWRTSCPRLTVWEDAVDSGWVRRERTGAAAVVALTVQGRERLRDAGRSVSA